MAEPTDADRVDAGHLTLDDLADADAGLTDPERTRTIRAHLSACVDCAAQQAELAEVGRLLAATAVPPMPLGVRARLGAVVAEEYVRRDARPATVPGQSMRPSLGSFGSTPGSPRRDNKVHWWRTALVAVVAAALVGFGGYVLSASAGLNEPVAATPVDVSSSELRAEATQLAQRSDLDAHYFSAAWRCAGRVVDGRITGIVSARVDDAPALLVYASSAGTRTVTVVTGCPNPGPTAGPSAVLPTR